MRRIAAATAVASILLIAACGESDDDDTSDTTATVAPETTAEPVTDTVPAVTSPSDETEPSEPVTESTVPGSFTASSLVPEGGATSPSQPGSGPTGTADEVAAIADLAQRQGVEEAAITVVSTDEVTWRNGSIGCPEPGMNYTQALVPGVRVILEIDGVRYQYHAGGGRSIFLCEKPEAPAEG